jgi:Flp pilus assembly protein TadD
MNEMNWILRLITLSLSFLLLFMTGCANQKNLSIPADNQSTSTLEYINWQSDAYTLIEVPQVKDIFYLNEASKQHFLTFYNEPQIQTIDGHKRLYNYLEHFFSGFTYKGDTYNADLASTKHAGNCLSLAILTKAYASLVGLKVEYRKVNSEPVYSRENDIMTISSHVQTHVYAPAKLDNRKSTFFFSKVIIDYFPSSRSHIGGVVENVDFESMYYHNLAAKALIEENFDYAYSLLAAAMQLSPNNIETLNTLAVLYKKSGNHALAESLYKYVLQHSTGSVSVLSNYVILLRDTGRNNEATSYENQYMHIKDDNPYRWYDVANLAYEQKKYTLALRLFQKTTDMAPYLPESFYGQAKTHFKLGNTTKAKSAMRKAAELAYTPKDERRYNSKLQVLNDSF